MNCDRVSSDFRSRSGNTIGAFSVARKHVQSLLYFFKIIAHLEVEFSNISYELINFSTSYSFFAGY